MIVHWFAHVIQTIVTMLMSASTVRNLLQPQLQHLTQPQSCVKYVEMELEFVPTSMITDNLVNVMVKLMSVSTLQPVRL